MGPNREILNGYIFEMRWQDLLAFWILFVLWIVCWYAVDLFKVHKLKRIFSKLGFTFDTYDPTLKNQFFSDFELLGEKRIRYARNVCRLQFRNGIEIIVFSLFVGISRCPVFVFEIPKLNSPHFLLTPHLLFFHKKVFSDKDRIKIENKEFSERYQLFSKNRNSTKLFFSRERIQIFERNQNVFMEGENRFLVLTFSNLRLTSKNAELFLKNVACLAKDFVEAQASPDIISPALLN